jgi:polyisoprenoid-binding protein YceI
MYWNTLIVLGVYLSLQLIMGILALNFTDQPGSRKTDAGTRGGNKVSHMGHVNSTNRTKTLAVIILGLLLSTGIRGHAGEEELCAPFLNGIVDQSRVEVMRVAAQGGHLYRIQPDTSILAFIVDGKLTHIKAEFKDFQGGLTLWPDHPDNKEQVMVMVKTASLDAGGSMINYVLKGGRIFDVENYPEILFVSTGFTWTGGATGTLKGDLTLHGVTRPVTFDVTLPTVKNKDDKNAGMVLVKADAMIHRSDFGMVTLSRVVNDDVALRMRLNAVRYVSADQNPRLIAARP